MSHLNMRLRRGLAGRVLPCGCLVGIYETYEESVVAMIDARGAACSQAAHVLHAVVVEASVEPGETRPDSNGPAGSTRSTGTPNLPS